MIGWYMVDEIMDIECVIVVKREKVYHCRNCMYLSRGFLSEPNECGYFKEAYKYFVPREGIAKWCPFREEEIAEDE